MLATIRYQRIFHHGDFINATIKECNFLYKETFTLYKLLECFRKHKEDISIHMVLSIHGDFSWNTWCYGDFGNFCMCDVHASKLFRFLSFQRWNTKLERFLATNKYRGFLRLCDLEFLRSLSPKSIF